MDGKEYFSTARVLPTIRMLIIPVSIYFTLPVADLSREQKPIYKRISEIIRLEKARIFNPFEAGSASEKLSEKRYTPSSL
jgi:hypothetical protein